MRPAARTGRDRAAVGEGTTVRNLEIAAGSRLADVPLIDDAVVGVVTRLDLRVSALVDGDARAQGQNGARAGQIIFVENAVISRRVAQVDRLVADGLRVVEIMKSLCACDVDRARPRARRADDRRTVGQLDGCFTRCEVSGPSKVTPLNVPPPSEKAMPADVAVPPLIVPSYRVSWPNEAAPSSVWPELS